MSRSVQLAVGISYTTNQNKRINYKSVDIPFNINVGDEWTEEDIIQRFKPRINLTSNVASNTTVSINGESSDLTANIIKKGNKKRSANSTQKRVVKPRNVGQPMTTRGKDKGKAKEMTQSTSADNSDSDSSNLTPPPPIISATKDKPERVKKSTKTAFATSAKQLAEDEVVSKHWKEFSHKTSADMIYLGEKTIPLSKAYFGEKALEKQTNRQTHLVYKDDAIILLVQPNSTDVRLARIVSFDSLRAVRVRESKSRKPIFGFQLKKESKVLNFLKLYGFNDDDWIHLFPNVNHDLFLPDYESKLVYSLKVSSKKLNIDLEKLSDDQVTSIQEKLL